MVMAMDRVSETVALTTRPSYQQTSVYSLFEICENRRHKQEVKLRPVLVPVKYSDTAYVYINSTRKRFVSRTFYEPRIRPKTFADTTYVNPKTTQETYVSSLDSYSDQLKKWFKTSVEIKPKNFKSSLSYPTDSTVSTNEKMITGYYVTNPISKLGEETNNSSMTNGYGDISEDVDENMNRRIPVFKEKYDPGASQVFIPKRRDASVKDMVLDQISDQILINYNSKDNSDFNSGYNTKVNGHTSDIGLSDF